MRNVWIGLGAAAIIIGGITCWQISQIGTPNSAIANNTEAASSASVVYDGTSFTPESVTIKRGGSVTFTSTGGDMWVASDPHPLHDGYDGNAQSIHCASGYPGPAPFDECKAGTSFTFTFEKSGAWGYHDHINDPVGGMVNVVE